MRHVEASAEELFQRGRVLLAACGYVGLLGCALMVGGVIAGSVLVPDHDWVAETISDMAAGPWHSIVDVALYGYAGGILAVAIGAAHLHLGGRGWSLGILCLALLALAITVIGARDEYGDREGGGVVVHPYVVYAMGVLWTAAPLLMARGLAAVSPWRRGASIACAVLWVLAAPAFYLVPTTIDGLWERGMGVVTVAWIALLSVTLIRAARA